MSKFNLGDVVIVNDKHTYPGDSFINKKGIITMVPMHDDLHSTYGVKFEGICNPRSFKGYFYFPIESLKGENEMTRPDRYTTRFTVIDEVHDWKPSQTFKNLVDMARRDAVCRSNLCLESIDHVIFNPPATIVFWADGSKTVVKCGENDEFDPEKGLAMAITKKALGNKHDYYDVFWKFLPKEYKKNLKNKKFKPCEEGYDEKEIMCRICEHEKKCMEMKNEP